MLEVSLSDLRSRVRQRANVEGYEDRHTDSQLNQYINNSWRKLYGKLATKQLIKRTITQVITATGEYKYPLPDDFFALYGVFEELQDGRGGHRHLTRHTAGHRPFGRPGPQGPAVTYDTAEQFDTEYIEFDPQPQSGTYVYVYVPEPNVLSDDADVIRVTLGFDEWVVLDAAIQVLDKDDLDASHLLTKLALIDSRIDGMATARDLLESTHIRDVRGCNFTDAADYTPYARAPGWFPGGHKF